MHILYTKKININRDMASFSRYETNGFWNIQTRVTYVPLKRATKRPSKILHFNTRHQQLHLIFKATMALDAHATYSSPSVTSVISSTTFWGSRMPPFFCTMTVFIVTPLGSFCGHSKWRAKETSRCRMATMSLSCIPGEKTHHDMQLNPLYWHPLKQTDTSWLYSH